MLKKTAIFLIMLLSIFCTISFGESSGNVEIKANKDIVQTGDEIEISVYLNDVETVAFNMTLYFENDKWEYMSNYENANEKDGRILFVWYDETGGEMPKQGKLVTFTFKAKEECMTTFKIEGDFYNNLGERIDLDFGKRQIKVEEAAVNIQNSNGSTNVNGNNNVSSNQNENVNTTASENINVNANLEILAIQDILLYPAFDVNVTKYEAEVSSITKNLNIFAVPEVEGAKIEIEGGANLQEGSNIVKVTVTAKDETKTKVYTIDVKKRNGEEQEKYNEEQENKPQELEEAYKIEKVSTDEEESLPNTSNIQEIESSNIKQNETKENIQEKEEKR